MISVRCVIAMLTALSVFAMLSAANANEKPRIKGRPAADAFALIGNKAMAAASTAGDRGRPTVGVRKGDSLPSDASGGERGIQAAAFRPVSNCVSFGTAETCGQQSECVLQRNLIIGFWGARPNDTCATTATPAVTPVAAAAAPPPAPPQVTPGLVLTALRRVGLPSLQVRTQPEDKTLVNFDTIFYADPAVVTRDLTLLGQGVRIEATPQSFTWHYGDGTGETTTQPGAPYPAKDIVHRYTDAHVTVQTRVDVTYAGRFQVSGGPWQAIPGTVTITGPPDPLRVSEATPVLSGDYS